MLAELFPRAHVRFASLRLLGPHLDGFIAWLRAQGYSDLPVRLRIREAPRLEALLGRRCVQRLGSVSRAQLLALAPQDSQDDVLKLTRFGGHQLNGVNGVHGNEEARWKAAAVHG